MTEPNFDFLHNISPGKHFYQFYKNSEDFFSVMIPFFQAGLAKGEACLWLVSERIGIERAKHSAESLISNCYIFVSTGQLTIRRAEDWYLSDGAFDEAKAIQNAEDYFANIQTRGYSVLRGAGDTGCVKRSDWEKVNEYEKKMIPWIQTRPVIALCAYPILECTPYQTKTVLECHDDVLISKM